MSRLPVWEASCWAEGLLLLLLAAIGRLLACKSRRLLPELRASRAVSLSQRLVL